MEMEPSPQRFSRRARAPNGRPQLNFAFCTSPGLHFFNRFLSQLENPGERISPWKNSWNLWNAYNFITKSLMSHSELLSLSCDDLCACCESCHAYVVWVPWFWSLAPLGCHHAEKLRQTTTAERPLGQVFSRLCLSSSWPRTLKCARLTDFRQWSHDAFSDTCFGLLWLAAVETFFLALTFHKANMESVYEEAVAARFPWNEATKRKSKDETNSILTKLKSSLSNPLGIFYKDLLLAAKLLQMLSTDCGGHVESVIVSLWRCSCRFLCTQHATCSCFGLTSSSIGKVMASWDHLPASLAYSLWACAYDNWKRQGEFHQLLTVHPHDFPVTFPSFTSLICSNKARASPPEKRKFRPWRYTMVYGSLSHCNQVTVVRLKFQQHCHIFHGRPKVWELKFCRPHWSTCYSNVGKCHGRSQELLQPFCYKAFKQNMLCSKENPPHLSFADRPRTAIKCLDLFWFFFQYTITNFFSLVRLRELQEALERCIDMHITSCSHHSHCWTRLKAPPCTVYDMTILCMLRYPHRIYKQKNRCKIEKGTNPVECSEGQAAWFSWQMLCCFCKPDLPSKDDDSLPATTTTKISENMKTNCDRSLPRLRYTSSARAKPKLFWQSSLLGVGVWRIYRNYRCQNWFPSVDPVTCSVACHTCERIAQNLVTTRFEQRRCHGFQVVTLGDQLSRWGWLKVRTSS